MKKYSLSFVFVCVLWFFGTAPVLGASVKGLDRIVSQIDSMFPPLEGVVVSVDRQILTLDLKQGQPIKQGDRLKLIRFGRDIIHPVSKQKIGRKETDLGEVEVIEVRQNFSLAKLMDPTTLVRASDGVRSPFNELTFVVATPRDETRKKAIDSDLLRMRLEEKLASHPRFQVPSFELDLWLLENNLSVQGLLTPKHLDQLESGSGNDAGEQPRATSGQGCSRESEGEQETDLLGSRSEPAFFDGLVQGSYGFGNR